MRALKFLLKWAGIWIGGVLIYSAVLGSAPGFANTVPGTFATLAVAFGPPALAIRSALRARKARRAQAAPPAAPDAQDPRPAAININVTMPDAPVESAPSVDLSQPSFSESIFSDFEPTRTITLRRLTPGSFRAAVKVGGFVAFDLETTGLRRAEDRICEVGAIRYDPRGREMDRFSSLVNPRMHIPSNVTQKNGIDDDMVADAPDASAVLLAFLAFVGDAPLIAYNAPYDISFLENALKRDGFGCDLAYADALAWARMTYELGNYKLATVARHIGYPREQDHRAESDSEMLGAVVRDMMAVPVGKKRKTA